MIKVKVTATELTVSPMAKLVLSRIQARDRAHNLKDLGGGMYETVNHVHFKKGEQIEVETVSKADMARVDIVEAIDIGAPSVEQAVVEMPRSVGRPRKM